MPICTYLHCQETATFKVTLNLAPKNSTYVTKAAEFCEKHALEAERFGYLLAKESLVA